MRYLALFFKLVRSKQRFIIVEASCWLALARLLILFARYPVQTRMLGQQKLDNNAPLQQCPQRAKQIGWAVRLAAKYLPWQCKCLAQAMAAQSMLRMRQMSGVVYIGVNKTTGEYKAHAWLILGDVYLTGGNDVACYQVIDRYTV